MRKCQIHRIHFLVSPLLPAFHSLSILHDGINSSICKRRSPVLISHQINEVLEVKQQLQLKQPFGPSPEFAFRFLKCNNNTL